MLSAAKGDGSLPLNECAAVITQPPSYINGEDVSIYLCRPPSASFVGSIMYLLDPILIYDTTLHTLSAARGDGSLPPNDCAAVITQPPVTSTGEDVPFIYAGSLRFICWFNYVFIGSE
ncbi:hypothetical protein CEXT_736731 [Caerostris extrusa]|uniref:Uncharacterized protein n=1 Tax=Caerostris extrusa TaxID=172846 RepID=A0AAV4N2M1_CAEEX|nr:hypothetical protein CEXT_736731 [Caerostris extrusa]